MKNELTAKRLQFALSNASMQQQELAEKSGVSKASISQYVNGSHIPSKISSAKIGEILNVEPMWLMGFDVEMRKNISSTSAMEDIELLKKFSLLTSRDKTLVLNMIDSMLSNEDCGL